MFRSNNLLIYLLLVLAFAVSATAFAEISQLEGDAAQLADSLNEGMFFTFIGIFLVGLALNLTPCVYPMMAVTVSIFGGQQESNTAKVFLRALCYVLGISTMYSVLGVFAALTGGLFGSILQSTAVLLTIAVIFLLLSLSMFGLYELRPPAALLNRLGNRKGTGYIGLYVSGLFVGIFAAPCVGPPVIGLLTLVGHYADPFFGFMAFFVLSMGLGLPYLILGTFAGLMQKLPRSGAWMNWVKKAMGIALVAVGCFYLSLALNPDMLFVLIPITLLAGGIYLGFIESSTSASNFFPWVKRLAGVILIIVAVMFYQSGQTPALEWQEYVSAKSNEGPTALYFSAAWCIPCLELDRMTFTDPHVIRAFSQFQRYKIDLTSYDSQESVSMREKYRIAGVPTLIFLDSSGNEIPSQRIVGFLNADEMLKRIEQVLETDASGVAQAVEDVEEDHGPFSRAEIISDKKFVVPGETFRLGVYFTMDQDWYIYWLNPGDSGEPALFSWDLPEGFQISQPFWPGPERFVSGPFATYGHPDEHLIFFEVTAPDYLPTGEIIEVGLDAEWLVCKKICVSQSDSLTFGITVGDSDNNTKSEYYQLFERAVALVPVAYSQPLAHSVRVDARTVELRFLPSRLFSAERIMSSNFYPYEKGVVRAGSFRWSQESDDMVVLSMARTGLPLQEDRMKGVLQLHNPDPAAYIELEFLSEK